MTKYPVFIVKGDAPLYGESWTDDYHIISKDRYVLGQTIITCDDNVTNARAMFALCRNLTSIDLSGFDTSKIFNMSYMFMECNNLTELNLSSFDTSSVYDMRWMFNECYKLTTLDLSSFDTSRVRRMTGMFWGCNNLTTIKGVIDMKSCTRCYLMFKDCFNLRDVKIKNPPAGFNGEGLNPSQYTIVS